MKKFLIIMLALTCAFGLIACDEEVGKACENGCTDENNDCVCDSCSYPIACVDKDGDGKCDVCAKDVESNACDEHKDENLDGICDSCGLDIINGGCKNHYDLDKDTKCEVCGKTVACTSHYDENRDGKCDVCGADAACGVHADKNLDNKCDRCGEPVCDGHKDINKDGKCDNCFIDYNYEIQYNKDAAPFLAALKAETSTGVTAVVKVDGDVQSTYTTVYNEDGSYVMTRTYKIYSTDLNAEDFIIEKTDVVEFDKDGECISGDPNVAAQIGAKGIKADLSRGISDYTVDGNVLVINVPAADSTKVVGVKLPSASVLLVTIDDAGAVVSITLDYVNANDQHVSIVCSYK